MALADRKWCLGCDTLDSFRGIPECCPLWEVLVLHIQGHGLRLKKKKKWALKLWTEIQLEGEPATWLELLGQYLISDSIYPKEPWIWSPICVVFQGLLNWLCDSEPHLPHLASERVGFSFPF